MEKPNYYAIIPANVRYSESINANEKLLFGEITALCNAKGYCWASNNYFADLFKCTPQAISKWINNLKNNNFLKIEYIYKNGSKEIQQRNICINNGLLGINNGLLGINNSLGGYQQPIKDNITSNNNIYIISENLTDTYTEIQTQAFTQVINNNSEIKYQYENNKPTLQIDIEYYKKFISKWNEYVLKYTNRKSGILNLTTFEKNQLKILNRTINEISEGLFILFNQNDKTTLPQCWTRPTHFLKEEQFLKYFEDAQNFKITKNITQFHKSNN